jgi:methyltransferase (TIGR00027 family)
MKIGRTKYTSEKWILNFFNECAEAGSFPGSSEEKKLLKCFSFFLLRFYPGRNTVKKSSRRLYRKVLHNMSICGAGFDTFCIRRPEFSSALRIYELDHPATQRMKQERIMELAEYPLHDVEFIAVDLEKETISDALSGSSFSKVEKAFFSWLGTVPYLTEDAVINALDHLASFAADGSEIVFDYLIPKDSMSDDEKRVMDKAMRIIERWGEPVTTYFDPDALRDKVSPLGYCVLENQSPAEQNARYFSDRSDNLQCHSAAYNIHLTIIND